MEVRDKRGTLVNVIMNFPVTQKAENLLASWAFTTNHECSTLQTSHEFHPLEATYHNYLASWWWYVSGSFWLRNMRQRLDFKNGDYICSPYPDHFRGLHSFLSCGCRRICLQGKADHSPPPSTTIDNTWNQVYNPCIFMAQGIIKQSHSFTNWRKCRNWSS